MVIIIYYYIIHSLFVKKMFYISRHGVLLLTKRTPSYAARYAIVLPRVTKRPIHIKIMFTNSM